MSSCCRSRLYRTNARSSHRDNTFCRFDHVPGFVADGKAFAVQMMVFEILTVHRLKSSEAHMQRDTRNLRAGVLTSLKNAVSEVKAGSRRGDRSALLCEYRLVTVAILGTIFTADVRRQRYVSHALN